MRQILFKLLLLPLIITSCQSETSKKASPNETPFNTSLNLGTRDTISSTILKEDRPIIVSLPKGYDKSTANYPVLYLTDGLQNIWHAIGTVEVLTRTGSIPPIIIVGIESTDRSRDFSPTKNLNDSDEVRGPKYLEFIEDELIPHVESNYRTHPYRILEGHSMGGLFAAYTLMEKPDLFNAHIIMSPSLWWNKEETTEKAKAFFKSHKNLDVTLFFGIGTLESSKDWGMRKELQNFIDVIEANKPVNLRFDHKEMQGEGHMSSPLLSNYYGLKSIFSDMMLPDEVKTDFTDVIFLNHEKNIMKKYGKEAKQSAEAYVNLAFRLINKERYSEAITVLNRSIEAYDYDMWLRSLLASTYEKNNQITEAIAVYKEAVQVSKKYKFAKEKEFEEHINRLSTN